VNRFILHQDPFIAARYHCDKHVVKMIVEEAQMLSTVHRLHGSTDERLYRATHRHHPCTVWAGETSANYMWGWMLLVGLCREYTLRYGKQHATSRLIRPLAAPPRGVHDGGLTPFPQAMPEHLRGPDPVEAYRRFYLTEKVRFAKWTTRPEPPWWYSEQQQLAAP